MQRHAETYKDILACREYEGIKENIGLYRTIMVNRGIKGKDVSKA